MDILPVCMCVHYFFLFSNAHRDQKRGLDHQDLVVCMIVSCRVGAKTNLCTLLSHLSVYIQLVTLVSSCWFYISFYRILT